MHVAARSGHGIALLPEFQMIDDLRAGRLFRLLEDYPSQIVPVHIVYPSRRNLATANPRGHGLPGGADAGDFRAARAGRGGADVAISSAGRRAIRGLGMRTG